MPNGFAKVLTASRGRFLVCCLVNYLIKATRNGYKLAETWTRSARMGKKHVAVIKIANVKRRLNCLSAPAFFGVIDGRAQTLHRLLLCWRAWIPAYAGTTKLVNKSVFFKRCFAPHEDRAWRRRKYGVQAALPHLTTRMTGCCAVPITYAIRGSCDSARRRRATSLRSVSALGWLPALSLT